jgi:hypothetical protein
VAALAEDLKGLDKVRGWVIDYFSPKALNYGRKLRARFMRAAPFLFQPKDWFGFFEEHGWHAEDVRYLGDEAEQLHRPMPLPPLMKVWLKLISAFVSRERWRAMQRHVAYVLLVPK